MAIITATAALASNDLKADLDRIASLADVASAEVSLNAEQKSLLETIKVAKVFDAPGVPSDEDLFGKITLKLGPTTQTLWSQAISAPVHKAENQSIAIAAEPEFTIDPDLINTYKLDVDFDVKDKIDGPVEAAGASAQAKADGFVSYNPGEVEVNVKDAQNANGGILSKTYTREEGSSQLQVALKLRLAD